jgi:hypothetical protein
MNSTGIRQLVGELGAHAMELPFVFQTIDIASGQEVWSAESADGTGRSYPPIVGRFRGRRTCRGEFAEHRAVHQLAADITLDGR